MSMTFSIRDVSADFIMDVSKVITHSSSAMSYDDVISCFNKSKTYVRNAISQCAELGLVINKEKKLFSVDKYSDKIIRSNRDQLFLSFREVLQKYPPFLIYIDFITKGYDEDESANIVKGILKINSNKDIIKKSLINWGKFSNLVIEENKKIVIPEAEKGMPTEYVKNLLNALQAELTANIFLIETMGPNSYSFLIKNGIGIDDLASSLINYESDPKTSTKKSTQYFEHFLFNYGENLGANVGQCNGIGQLISEIRSNKGIMKNPMHISNAIGAIRNMSHHDPDKESGKPWNITPQSALISTILVPTTIKTIYEWHKEHKQEF